MHGPVNVRSSIIGQIPGSSTLMFLTQYLSLDQYITHLAEASFGDESTQCADVAKLLPSRPHVKHPTKITNYNSKWTIVTVTQYYTQISPNY